MLKVGVIGTGGMGGRHIRNLHNQTPADVVAVMDVDQERARAVAESVGESKIYTNADALIHDADVEAVVIASPDRFHAAAVLSCIAAGKPTLCEKPLAMSTAEAKEVLEAEIDGGKRLVQLGFMREYDPAHRAVKAAVERGELGDVLMFRGIHTGYGGSEARTAADVINNSSVHDIHSARWLLQQEVKRAYVQHVVSDPERPETCRLLVTQLTFENGSLAVLEVNAEAPFGYQVDVELTGSKASIRTPRAFWPTMYTAGQEWQGIDDDWLQRFDLAYVYEVQAWVAAVISGRPAGPSTWDGYAAMVVSDACIDSVQSGQPEDVPVLTRPLLYS